jgi:hypothetical protein
MSSPSVGKVIALQEQCKPLFLQITLLQKQIKEILSQHADGRKLKGHEHVAWLGEIYGKILLGGQLVMNESEEHDFFTDDLRKVSVKARKGWNSGWKTSSTIPKIDGEDCPTHLMFVHLDDDYSLEGVWLFEWSALRSAGRLTPHIVRNSQRGFIFRLDERRDSGARVYPASDSGKR